RGNGGAPQNGGATAGKPPPAAISEPGAGNQLAPLRGAAARIAENMETSLSGPIATSFRTLPVKVMDENQRIINQYRALTGQGKVSFTHIIGWAIVRAVEEHPNLNHSYAEKNGEPQRLVRDHVNLGIAIDVAGKDGTRSLMVPNIRNAQDLDFYQ